MVNQSTLGCKKGIRKRKITCFQKGHAYFKPEYKELELEVKKICRLPQNIFNVVAQRDVSDDLIRAYGHGQTEFIKDTLLRPSPSEPDEIDNLLEIPPTKNTGSTDIDTYRLLHLGKTCDLFNNAFKQHSLSSKECSGQLIFDTDAEKQRGLAWKMALKCNTCSYKSAAHRLYTVLDNANKRGPKPAAINLALQVGLSHNGIGNTGFRNIVQAINMPPPSLSYMQKNANTVGNIIQTLNDLNMKEVRQNLKEISVLRGLDSESKISAEADCRYNNNLYSGGGKTPFQPATQSVFTMCENHTPSKKVIGVYTANKLCKAAQILRSKGEEIVCPNHEGVCTANISEDSIIGDEERWSYSCYREILSEPDSSILVGTLATDGDSSIAKGASQALKEVTRQSRLDNSKCIRHLGQSQKRAITRTQFSLGMFPGKTISFRDRLKRLFALDLKYRCQAEFTAAYNKYRGNLEKMTCSLSFSTDAIIACYNNECGSTCKKYSLVCGGRKAKKFKNPYYNTLRWPLNITAADEKKLRQMISIRLGPSALKSTHKATSTQKAEAINRSYNRTNPKNITFSRNFSSRIHSAVHLVNNGLSCSIVKKTQAVGAPITAGSKVAKSLLSASRREQYKKLNSKSNKSKVNRALCRARRYKLYDKKIETNSSKKTYYRKDANIAELLPKKTFKEHNYSKC